jgi:hypothetical protein
MNSTELTKEAFRYHVGIDYGELYIEILLVGLLIFFVNIENK